MQTSFYRQEELPQLGLKRFGKNVFISRKSSIYSPENIEIGDHVRIDDFCILSGSIIIGNYIHIAAFCGLFGVDRIVLKNYCGLSSRVTIYSGSDDFLGESMTNPMIPAKYRIVHQAPVILEEHVIVGAGSVILPGVTLGTGAAVGALSLVTKDCEPWTVYFGNPARRLKVRRRDIILRYQAELEAEVGIAE